MTSTTANLLCKRTLGSAWRLLGSHRPRRLILLYHSVGSGQYAISPARFFDQINWLSQNARIVPLSDLMAGTYNAPLQVALTFDDGYASLHHVVLPALNALHGVGTVFLNSGWVSDDVRRPSVVGLGHYPNDHFLLWREVEILIQSGWEVGSHGTDHLDLTACDSKIAFEQLIKSKDEIEHRLGRECTQFSYTWGRNSRQLRDLVAKAGYHNAYTGVHASVREGTDPMAIPRINIAQEYGMEDFAALIRGDWDYIGGIQKLRGLLRRVLASP